ncbi:MAG: hypothetical protein LBM93_03805 [Oscillospiraceae bacterium]|jgi:hypothetical protein|nr:hypothetical protein [Oscillospiraceae bacterium]
MKQGIYTFYKGIEFCVNKIADDDTNVELSSTNSFALELGFYIDNIQKNGTLYKKKVPKSEISECYKIRTYSIYKGIKCAIWEKKDKKHYILFFPYSSPPSPPNEDFEKAKQLGFSLYDRGAYMKDNVPIEDLELYEVREEHKI